MDNRLILPLLCAASAVAFAAAPFSHDEKPIATARHHAAENAAPIVTTFDITRPKNDAEKLRFTLSVKNNTTKMLELRFPDGQTHDFYVKDFAGKVIWRWSEGRMFTSAMRSETLKGKGETAFEESWNTEGQHGSFTAVAILKSNNFPVETSVQFMLP
jgi:Intracellular proteinase inhibitor